MIRILEAKYCLQTHNVHFKNVALLSEYILFSVKQLDEKERRGNGIGRIQIKVLTTMPVFFL